MKNHEHGTIIRFEGLRDEVKHSYKFLRKVVALYFRFSLLDDKFSILVDDDKVTHKDLNDLAKKTEFLWRIGTYDDPFLNDLETEFVAEAGKHESKTITLGDVKGFLATVKRPSDLKVLTMDERVGVDLFVNGRLRERDILKHIPTARLVEKLPLWTDSF